MSTAEESGGFEEVAVFSGPKRKNAGVVANLLGVWSCQCPLLRGWTWVWSMNREKPREERFDVLVPMSCCLDPSKMREIAPKSGSRAG